MIIYTKKEDCCGCGACVVSCSQNAIFMKQDKEGFLYPKINQSLCKNCNKCQTVCPIKHSDMQQSRSQFYGARALDQNIRERSSSGGIFSLLANYVLKRNGSVFAAGFDENMNVVHKEIWKVQDLDSVRRSKYVQSVTGNIFQDILHKLSAGSWVLFTGTPCQTEALRLYLNKPYARLILADLICYGASSPGIWKSYIHYLEKQHDQKILDYYFRDKRNHDNGHMVSWKTKKEEKICSLYSDPYSRMYFQNVTIRPSCYQCQYCKPHRNSDFTLGDFWGIEKIRPNIDDGMGTSLVIVHTTKGKQIWEEIRKQCLIFECQEKDALQPRLQTPTKRPWKRELFMQAYKWLPFSFIMKKFKY